MIESAIVHELASDATLIALIGNAQAATPALTARISPNHAGQDQALPRIVYRVVSREGVRRVSDGPRDLCRVRVQLDIYDDDYSTVVAVSDRVRRLLDGLRGTIGPSGSTVEVDSITLEDHDDISERAQDGGSGTIHRRSMDFMIWHREAVGR